MALERGLRLLASLSAQTMLALISTTAACSATPEKGEPNSSGGSAAVSGYANTAKGGEAASGAGVAPGGASGASGGSSAGGSSMGGSGSASPAAGASCRDDVSESEWAANCLSCAGDDACASCLCMNCAEEMRACDATDGCPEIAACVQSAGCTGIDCYCGTDAPGDCANGGGNGPCKDAILAAPGGRAPTPADLSGGPASDAVAQVALCMQNPDACGSNCN